MVVHGSPVGFFWKANIILSASSCALWRNKRSLLNSKAERSPPRMRMTVGHHTRTVVNANKASYHREMKNGVHGATLQSQVGGEALDGVRTRRQGGKTGMTRLTQRKSRMTR